MSPDPYEVVIGLEVHVAARDEDRRSSRVVGAPSAPAEQHDLSGLPGSAGHAAGAEPRGVDFGLRLGLARAAARSASAAASRASTTSIPTCPRAIRSRSTTSRSASGGTRRSSACDGEPRAVRLDPHPPGGGRRQEHPRRRAATSLVDSTAPASRCSRSSASPTSAPPRRRRVPARAAHAGALPRHLRRQHGGGLAPLRRQRVAAPARRDAVRHQDRDQEHELVQERARRDRARGQAPGGGPRRRRARRAGDAAVGPRRAQ